MLYLVLLTGFSQMARSQCSGTPAAGTITATNNSGCVSYATTLGLTSASATAGISYQWDSSLDGVTYYPISGANNSTYSTTIATHVYFICTLTCSLSSLSSTTPAFQLTVDLPTPITGTPTACAGFTRALSDATPGGTWASGNTSIATVNPSTGIVSGVNIGITNITYTTPGGCVATTVFTVNSLPEPITGTAVMCMDGNTTLSDLSVGGLWYSQNAAIASVDILTGVVSPVGPGNVNITYSVPSTGCINVRNVTVNPLPLPITGIAGVCEGATTSLYDASPAGAWSSVDPAIANVDVVSGVVTGYMAGTVNINYTFTATGCHVAKQVTVYPTPALTGPGGVCIGTFISLGNSITGGTWTSADPAIATVGSSFGIVTGIALGTTTISYAVITGGCFNTTTITVFPLPDVYHVTGGGSYCAGGTGVPVNIDGSQIGVSYQVQFGSSSSSGYMPGTGSAMMLGMYTVADTYRVKATDVTTGCISYMADSTVVIVNPLLTPSVSITTATGDSTCSGLNTTFIPVPVHGGATPTYSWSVNGTPVSALSPAYTFIPLNGDIISVVMHTTASCVTAATATGSMKIAVLPNEAPTVTISIDPGDTVCQFNGAIYTGVPSYGGSAPYYQWYVNGSLAGVGASFTNIPVNGDLVYVRMASNYLCRTADTVSSATTAMVVQPLILPHVNVVGYPGPVIDSGTYDTLVAHVVNAGPNPAYQWYLNGVIIPGATDDTFISNTFANYDSVSCSVTSSGVCRGISSYDWIFVSYTPPHIHHVGVAGVTADMDVVLMPNPNKGTFAVKGKTATAAGEAINIEITNMLGQVVYSKTSSTHSGRINEQIITTGLASGMYVLNISTATDHQAFHFVIEE